MEELYSLVDLKNSTIVDKEFKKCTGHTLFSGILEKIDSKLLLDNVADYAIELR